ncbi:MAG: hypothetical protein SVR04_06700 [Spirochaetota bacterium]|nr:hypothetical protein [Spirochaetota bacterium]
MSSKRRIRRRSCEGKVRHESLEAAKIACREMRRQGEIVRPYHCRFCGGYHVGHYNRRKVAEARMAK